ncbi:MAG: BatD family protein [Oligosphaeraceae bacterium]
MRHSSFPFWFLALLLVAGGISLQGAPSLQVRVDKNVLSLQDPLRVAIILSDDANPLQSPPQKFPLPSGLPFQVLRQNPPEHLHNSSTQIINGRRSQVFQDSITYSFLVIPLQEGECTIPSLSLEYQGQTLRSEPVVLQVTRDAPSEPQKGMTYQLHLSRSRTVPGAPVTLTLECLIPRNIGLRQLAPSLDLDSLQGDFAISPPETTPRGQILWSRAETVRNGVPYLRFSLEVGLTPLRPGTYVIPPCTMEVLYTEETQRRTSFFDFMDFPDPFDTRATQETLIAQAVTLEVEDFPQEGRPDGFSGLLGPIQITAAVDQTTPRVGDPIQLTLRLRGDNLSPQSPLPPWEKELESLPAFKCFGNDPVLPEQDGSLLIQRTLRPLQPGPQEIPAIPIPFYDPVRGQYGIAVSEPILLQVQKSEGAAVPVPSPASAPAAKAASPAPGPSSPGMAMPEETPPPSPALSRRTILWGVLLPAALLLLGFLLRGFLLWRKSRLHSPAYRRRKAREALEQKLEALEAEGTPQAAAQAARAWEDYLCQRFPLQTPITAQALEEAACQEGLPAETLKALQGLLTRCDAAQYGIAAAPLAPLKEEILDTLQKM